MTSRNLIPSIWNCCVWNLGTIPATYALEYWRFIERVLRTRIEQVEPLLQKVNPQQNRQTYWLTTAARLGIARLDQRFQFPPRNHSVHDAQKLLPLALPTKLLADGGRLARDSPKQVEVGGKPCLK